MNPRMFSRTECAKPQQTEMDDKEKYLEEVEGRFISKQKQSKPVLNILFFIDKSSE